MSKNISHLQHVKSSVVESGKPKLPTAGILAEGEIAVNYADGYETLSIKSSSGNIKTFSSDEYYTEQKLGSRFTGENSARTVTDVIEAIHENDATVQDVNNLPIPPSGDCTTLEEYIDEALEGARLVNAELSGSVVSITNNSGQTTSIDLLNATEETVQIVVTTSVVGVDVSGLTINVYYNGATTPTTAVTTDENGMVALRVPNGYTYKLIFPSVQGCEDIAPVVHTAAVSQRSVEVEYKEYESTNGEKVTVLVRDFDDNVYTKVSGVTITVIYSSTTVNYTTDNNGTVTFYIPYGQSYSVTTQNREGKHVRYAEYTQTYTAQSEERNVYFTYYNYEVGIFVITEDGSQYSLTQWKELVESGAKQNSDALYIKVTTADLAKNNGTFVIDIDMVREKNYGSNLQWCDQNVQFNEIPLNGNSVSQPYYYDGLTASELIKQEGFDRDLQTPAVNRCFGLSITIGEKTAKGFLGSIGQWSALWANVAEIDEILVYTRPSGTYTMSSQTQNKWTSTQNSATNAWGWAAAAINGSAKPFSYTVVPFFAF